MATVTYLSAFLMCRQLAGHRVSQGALTSLDTGHQARHPRPDCGAGTRYTLVCEEPVIERQNLHPGVARAESNPSE